MKKEQWKSHRVFMGFNACLQGNVYWEKILLSMIKIHMLDSKVPL